MTTFQFTKLVDKLTELETHYNRNIKENDTFMTNNEAYKVGRDIALVKNIINGCGFGKIEFDEDVFSHKGLKPIEYIIINGERYEMG